MRKNILIGSIIAVAILVLVSFTGVVGYQTTKSSTIARASPLFSIRTQRAIDEESKDIACDYVGKGEESFLSIPKRNNKTALNQKVLDMICAMDDITFNKFMNLVVNRIRQRKELKDVNINEVINTFHQLRSHPERIGVDYDNNNGDSTWYETPTICWFPFCLYVLFTLLLENIIITIAILIIGILGYFSHWCPYTRIPQYC